MTAQSLAKALQTIIAGYTTPRASLKSLDRITEAGCDAGNRLGATVRRVDVETNYDSPCGRVQLVRVTLRDGSQYDLEVMRVKKATSARDAVSIVTAL